MNLVRSSASMPSPAQYSSTRLQVESSVNSAALNRFLSSHSALAASAASKDSFWRISTAAVLWLSPNTTIFISSCFRLSWYPALAGSKNVPRPAEDQSARHCKQDQGGCDNRRISDCLLF